MAGETVDIEKIKQKAVESRKGRKKPSQIPYSISFIDFPEFPGSVQP